MERTWLDALPSHAIFSNSIASTSRIHQHHQGEQQLPPSPGLSPVASFNGGDDSTILLQAGTILSSSKLKRNAMCVVRKTELLVAVGSSIRLGDLAHFKTRVEAAGGAALYGEAAAAAAGNTSNSTFHHGDVTNNTDYAGSSSLGSFKVRLPSYLYDMG